MKNYGQYKMILC